MDGNIVESRNAEIKARKEKGQLSPFRIKAEIFATVFIGVSICGCLDAIAYESQSPHKWTAITITTAAYLIILLHFISKFLDRVTNNYEHNNL